MKSRTFLHRPTVEIGSRATEDDFESLLRCPRCGQLWIYWEGPRDTPRYRKTTASGARSLFPTLNLIEPGRPLEILDGLRAPNLPFAAKTEMLRQIRTEVVNPYMDTKLVLGENVKRLGWKVEEAKLQELSGRLASQPEIGVRIEALLEVAPEGGMKGYLEGALKAYKESKGEMNAALLNQWESSAAGRGVSLSDASVALFGQRGMFNRLQKTLSEAIAMTPAEVRVRKEGVLLRFKFQGEKGELWRGDLWVTERGLKGELVDMSL